MTSTTKPADLPWPPARYAWYVVGVLWVANAIGFVDRTILSLLIVPIQQDLGIGDTEISLLHGLAFVIFYTVLGVPIARLADRASRRSIIGIGIFSWSVMTAACGIAQNFLQLFLARIGVGAGEATLAPSAYSIMSDYFPRERLPKAMSVYSSGIYVGGGLALIIGGAVIELVTRAGAMSLPVVGVIQPWQAAFIAVGLPGIAIAALMATVKEPYRRGTSRQHADGAGKLSSIPVARIFRYFKDNARTYIAIFGGFSLMIFAGYGAGAWLPTFFVRTYGWTPAEVGLWYGSIVLVFGTLGALCGGWFASWLIRRGHVDGHIRATLTGAVCLLPVAIVAPLMPTAPLALAMLALVNFFAAFPFGGGSAALQAATPNQMRAQVSAMFMLCINLIGVGFGPTFVALLTDFVFHDESALRYSLSITWGIIIPLAILALWSGLKPFRASLDYSAGWTR